ncbi:hypothetical protein QRL17_002591 [Vibrio parahaemolyticus]|nr:hypothetical protein [Vibrio parahaemolyticus]OKQ13626.1 hypothetical protein H058_12435 [Vibrio antiquarius]ELA9888045.1 hypothetical protein [Vibrio parahaemolyticus]HBC3398493.1 hypothetical protein [Vibrio parahaemolyticus]HCG8758426.1 hypothetical protein [Vibrio parahaemolyticus]
MELARLIFIEFSPFLKRIFYFNSTLYFLLSLIPLCFLFSRSIEIVKVVSSFILVFLLVVVFDLNIMQYAPVIVVLFISSTWIKKTNLDDHFSNAKILLMLALSYAIYQKLFGYTIFELGWMRSGLGYVGEVHFTFTEDIRPFSFFSGIPEAAIFFSILSYYFLSKKNWIMFTLAIVGIVVVGSRGVLFATVISYFVLVCIPGMSFSIKAIFSIVISLVVYSFIVYVYPLYSEAILSFFNISSESRLAVYGTFNARVLSLTEFFSKYDSLEFWFSGVRIEDYIKDQELAIDNFYLRIINDFGVIFLIIFLASFIYFINSKKRLFCSSLFLSYGFYSDIFPSLFIVYLLAITFLTREIEDEKCTDSNICI